MRGRDAPATLTAPATRRLASSRRAVVAVGLVTLASVFALALVALGLVAVHSYLDE